MQRAGVFIGVDQTGTLPKLRDAAASARRMHRWAITQGMQDASSAVLVTDADGPVTPDLLTEVVDRVIQKTSPEQLLVYFAGHGTILRRSEHWLLSKAPTNPTHAVDLAWSADAAINGQVPNVVFISDACRTAPEGIQAQNVQGGSLFTNDPMPQEYFVDTYFASALGRPAAEIKDEKAAVDSYRAVYTEVLLDALNGSYPKVFQRRGGGDEAWYADLRQLRDTLREQVPRRIRDKKLTVRFGQVPQARITSDPGSWLARLDRLPAARPAAAAPPATPDPLSEPPRSRQLVEPMAEALHRTTGMLLLRGARDHFETACGITIAGASITQAYTQDGQGAVVDDGQAVRVQLDEGGLSILLRLDAEEERGLVALVPVLAGYLTRLTIDQGELLAVEYEPSTNSPRWNDFAAVSDMIRALRSEVTSACAFGVFDPDDHTAAAMADRVRYGKTLDPSLALYAGYAYYESRDTDTIGVMSDMLRADLGVTFFDLELLARRLGKRAPGPDVRLLPGVPLLSQGWSLIRSHGVQLPQGLDDVERQARDSLWSLYRAEAWDQFKTALETGVLR